MSRSFTAFPLLNYIGQPYDVPVSFCGMDVRLVPLDLLWANYGAGASRSQLGVNVNMKAGGVKSPIAQIAGVVIDNTGCPVPIYVVFDSGMVVTCQPFAQVFSPAWASDLRCAIYADGFTAATPGMTRVLLLDKPAWPFTNVETQQVIPYHIASPSIQRTGSTILNQNYGPPALGDQSVIRSFPLTTFAVTNVLPAQASGYYYLTSIWAAAVNYSITLGAPTEAQVVFSNDQSTQIFLWSWGAMNGSATMFTLLMQMSGMNLKLDATRPWSMYGLAGGGQFNNGGLDINLVYTYNPNL